VNQDDIEQHIPSLRRYARALTGNGENADDLVQDVCERAWRRRHLWRGEGSGLRAWLFTIMRNLNINQHKYRQRRPTQAVSHEDQFGATPPSQEHSVELLRTREALARLPNEQREVLLMVVLEGMTYDETAQALGIPIGTVMSRLHRARDRLQREREGNVVKLERVK
jgi:RNA polymerase sigma-70 factor (ECF subfamily)